MMQDCRAGWLLIAAALFLFALAAPSYAADRQPNILFIAVDDLNDWIGCMGGHPQTQDAAPSIVSRRVRHPLHERSLSLRRPAIPSRTVDHDRASSPRTSPALYAEPARRCARSSPTRELHAEATFHRPRLLRHGARERSCTTSSTRRFLGRLLPRERKRRIRFRERSTRRTRPVQHPCHGAGRGSTSRPTGAALDATDEEFGGDWLVSKNGSARNWPSKRTTSRSFWRAAFYRPHEPWFVPKKYFEPFPLESIASCRRATRPTTSTTCRRPAGNVGPNRYFAHIREHKTMEAGQSRDTWHRSHFADAMVGNGSSTRWRRDRTADNTIVVLWSRSRLASR